LCFLSPKEHLECVTVFFKPFKGTA
jgi:hypothetical protein